MGGDTYRRLRELFYGLALRDDGLRRRGGWGLGRDMLEIIRVSFTLSIRFVLAEADLCIIQSSSRRSGLGVRRLTLALCLELLYGLSSLINPLRT